MKGIKHIPGTEIPLGEKMKYGVPVMAYRKNGTLSPLEGWNCRLRGQCCIYVADADGTLYQHVPCVSISGMFGGPLYRRWPVGLCIGDGR